MYKKKRHVNIFTIKQNEYRSLQKNVNHQT
jgi:hypothetical protein